MTHIKMIPIISFYVTPCSDITNMYNPPADECRIIKRFIDYGYAVNVDSTKPCPTKDIKRLQGLYWEIGAGEVEFVSDYSDGEVFMLIYFNEHLTEYELESARAHFAGMLGLSTFTRKRVTRSLGATLGSRMFEPYTRQVCSSSSQFDDTECVDGKFITQIVGGVWAEKVDNLCSSLVPS
jgi:hypothetical protein